jgi:flagellar protein FliO/FliZ
MFDTLFGADMPLAVRFFLAFLIVLALIGATAWAVRRFGAGRLGSNTRGRQPRLAVIDYASVDGRRRLILVRRDNVEHLLMIGGPTDVVVEPNIVRATAAPRDVPGARTPAGIDALPRAIPLPETGNGGSWPLQPEPAASPRLSPRLDLPEEVLPKPPQPAAEPPRPQRDTLAALADELSTPQRPTPPAPATPALAPRSRLNALRAGAAAAEPTELEPRAEPRIELRPEPKAEPKAEPRLEPRKPLVTPSPAPPAAAPAAEAPTTADQSLADMAQRLEAALRKQPEGRPAPAPSRAAPKAEPAAAADTALPPPPPPPPRQRAGEPRGEAKRAEAKPNQAKTQLYDTLEQEMASLLGRPNKP